MSSRSAYRAPGLKAPATDGLRPGDDPEADIKGMSTGSQLESHCMEHMYPVQKGEKLMRPEGQPPAEAGSAHVLGYAVIALFIKYS
jgi:hypothetical protein